MSDDNRIRAPFTIKQIEGLRAWQGAWWVHPFTCPNGHSALSPERDGWRCGECEFRQTWAHEFMAEGPPADPVREMFRPGRRNA